MLRQDNGKTVMRMGCGDREMGTQLFVRKKALLRFELAMSETVVRLTGKLSTRKSFDNSVASDLGSHVGGKNERQMFDDGETLGIVGDLSEQGSSMHHRGNEGASSAFSDGI